VDLEITPRPGDGERRALELALRRLRDERPRGPYESRWRTTGLPAREALPAWVPGFARRSPGAKRA
jgi:hypothetical protein